MATQRYISTSFWDDEWIQSLDPSEKLLYLYLMTNPLTNIAGIYKLTLRRIVFDTGFNEDTVSRILKRFQKDKKAYLKGEYILLPSWPKHQKYNERSNIKSGIDAILRNLPNEIWAYIRVINYAYPYLQEIGRKDKGLQGPSQPSHYLDINLDSDLDIDLDTDTRFSFSAIIKFIDYWNNIGLPKYPEKLYKSGINIPHSTDIIKYITAFTEKQITTAMDNYKRICTNPEFRPFPTYPDVISFLSKGIHNYYDEAAPFDRCKKGTDKKEPPETKYQEHEAIIDPRDTEKLSAAQTKILREKSIRRNE